MERLTYRNHENVPFMHYDGISDETTIRQSVVKLAAYEDAEEQGRVFDPIQVKGIELALEELKEYRELKKQGRLLPCGFFCTELSDDTTLAVFYPDGRQVMSEKRQEISASQDNVRSVCYCDSCYKDYVKLVTVCDKCGSENICEYPF